MLEDFGERVKRLRLEKGLTKEVFCQDESELSMRQLTRIESGESVPTLRKAVYIAERLGVTLDYLTDGRNIDLPNRYKELKYLLLRTPTYGDQEKLAEREVYFDEIFNQFYDTLPEEEQLVIDALQSKLDIHLSQNIDFGVGILNDYFDQILMRKRYQVNDLIIIDLYFSCLTISDLRMDIFDLDKYHKLMQVLLKQSDYLPVEDLFVLNNVLLNNFGILLLLEKYDIIKELIAVANDIMVRTSDFQKKPIVSILEWKYYLLAENNEAEARKSYDSAILFAKLTENTTLREKLEREWQKDYQNRT
ncbi:helix-turn-helix domain-containing protein [Streptococcus ratti]|uniref:Helix-turn-helix transcriptional regulator n=1 Tax=Streptococcus ratti TaxID=1341 RepID=A0A7X9QHW2_STRRT|nr:helix-turn-helix domain-containing protein [Streptococcus ratti]NMD49630.1 helix-turn-helix transcriptional regulator [Streptococcus ratti]